MKRDLKNLDFQGFSRYLESIAQPQYRTQQIFSWMYQKRLNSFESMKNIPKDLIKRLKEDFYLSGLIIKEKLKSKDGTQKFLFGLEDGNVIESVFIPQKERKTLCLSTQVGCKFACDFCASGKLGFMRNLTQAEILNQIIFIMNELKATKITNIVFMGIGEPLDNYDNVLSAIRIINSKDGFNIGQRKITISTAGLVDGIKRLSREGLQIELSVSLHSADDTKRSKIMPINKKYPLQILMPALKEFTKLTKRKVTFEYMLLGEFNTCVEDAKLLINTIKGIHCKINLIPFNPVSQCGFLAPTKMEVLYFQDYILKNHFEAMIRRPRGQDIQAACGQLRLHSIKNKR